jgi:hypothetical protein
MGYIIVIPSYNRADLLNRKTLKVLNEYHIPRDVIYVFVANKEEEEIYKKTLNPDYYGHLIVGVKGLKNQRNFISSYFKEGQEILNLDDDIGGFKILKHKSFSKSSSKTKKSKIGIKNNKTKKNQKRKSYRKDYFLETLGNLDNFIKSSFKILRENKLYLWGIYPIANPYFMFPEMTTDLKLIVGPCWGVINRHDNDLVSTIDEKEDVERTLQYYSKDNGVVRFNNVSVQTTYYKTPGGMQTDKRDRKKDAYESAVYLNNKYPNLTKLYLGKKSGYAEVKLKKHF